MSYQVSEYVSPGHPDKIADGISSYILDKYLDKDPSVRFAVETVVKGRDCVLAGELTSKVEFRPDEIACFAREAYAEIGYTDEYARKWGRDNVCGASDLKITQIVDRQSPDISQGVDGGGWGDQGVFWGMAVADPSTDYMPKDCWLARQIGSRLYSRAKADGICLCGLSCAIGKSLVKGVYKDADGNVKSKFEMDLPTYKVIADLNLDKPGFFNRVRNGLFTGM